MKLVTVLFLSNLGGLKKYIFSFLEARSKTSAWLGWNQGASRAKWPAEALERIYSRFLPETLAPGNMTPVCASDFA